MLARWLCISDGEAKWLLCGDTVGAHRFRVGVTKSECSSVGSLPSFLFSGSDTRLSSYGSLLRVGYPCKCFATFLVVTFHGARLVHVDQMIDEALFNELPYHSRSANAVYKVTESVVKIFGLVFCTKLVLNCSSPLHP